MLRYRFAHLTIASEFELASLPPSADDVDVDVHVYVDREPLREFDVDWITPLDERTQLVRSSFFGSTLVMDLDVEGRVRIVMDVDSGTVHVSDPDGVDRASLEHLIADSALPHYVAVAGTPVLHGSAVESNGQVIVALGDSGAGKSTLAAHFIGAGCRLVTDDAVVLVRRPDYSVVPVTRFLRLYGDSVEAAFDRTPETRRVGAHTAKNHVGVNEAEWVEDYAPLPLGVILNLDRTATYAPQLTAPTDRIAILDNALFGSVGGPAERRIERFDLLTGLARDLQIWNIGIERTPDGTERALQQIFQLASRA